jgi:membrane protease YdiL (CAAX protease family)
VGKAALDYFRRSELPLASLLFLLPLIIAFEVASRFYYTSADPIAFWMIGRFFSWFGVTGRMLPMLALIAILLFWHMARRDPWKLDIRTMPLMAVETMLLSLPLLVLRAAIVGRGAALGVGMPAGDWAEMAVSSIGAGIYEEAVFRLFGMTALYVVLVDVLRLPRGWSSLLMVLGTAVLFSAYHYLGAEVFQWRSFTFRTVAGIYFAVLFLTRGFGITSGVHIFYDLLISVALWLR